MAFDEPGNFLHRNLKQSKSFGKLPFLSQLSYFNPHSWYDTKYKKYETRIRGENMFTNLSTAKNKEKNIKETMVVIRICFRKYDPSPWCMKEPPSHGRSNVLEYNGTFLHCPDIFGALRILIMFILFVCVLPFLSFICSISLHENVSDHAFHANITLHDVLYLSLNNRGTPCVQLWHWKVFSISEFYSLFYHRHTKKWVISMLVFFLLKHLFFPYDCSILRTSCP